MCRRWLARERLDRGRFFRDDSGRVAGDNAHPCGLSLTGGTSTEPADRSMELYHHYRWVIDAQEDFDILVWYEGEVTKIAVQRWVREPNGGNGRP